MIGNIIFRGGNKIVREGERDIVSHILIFSWGWEYILESKGDVGKID